MKTTSIQLRPKESTLERRFRMMWEQRYPHLELTPEYRFAPPRRYRFDFYRNGVAVELEGGIWNNGAHSRGEHFNSDAEKYNLAASKGIYVFRLTTDMLEGEKHLATIADFMEAREVSA